MIKPLEILIIAAAIVAFIVNAGLLGAALLGYLCWAIVILALIPACIRTLRARRTPPSPDDVR